VFTNIVYDNGVNDKRFEGKLTYAISQKHTVKVGYTKKDRFESNNTFGRTLCEGGGRQRPESGRSRQFGQPNGLQRLEPEPRPNDAGVQPLHDRSGAGCHFELGPNFGRALSPGDYQAARSYFFSLGFRF